MTGAADVVVNHCTVTIVRHGGWSWGPQPRHLTSRVLAALQALVADRLAELAVAGDDMEIIEPVRIAVRLPLADLLAAPHAPPAAADIATANAPPEVMPPATGVRSAAGRAAGEAGLVPSAGRAAHRGAETAPPAERPRAAPPSLLQLLADLSRKGHLDLLLSMLPQAMLDSWYRALLGPAGGELPPTATTSFADQLNRLHELGELAALAAVLPSATRQAWRLALSSAVGVDPAPMLAVLAHATDGGLGAATGVGTRGSGDEDSLERLRGSLAALAALAARAGVTEIERLLRVPTSAPADPPAAATSAPARPVEVEIDCVLPFLFLGPLARAGYLGAIGPALDIVGLTDAAGLFATALSATVVPPAGPRPPGAPSDDLSVVFGGLPAPPSPAALGTFAERASPALPALNAILATSLVMGREKTVPLLLTTGDGTTDGRLLLADIEGLFPIIWPGNVEEILVTWRACGSPVLMVAPAAARKAVLRQLDQAGVRFLVDVPPTRSERWHRLPGPDEAWTNHPTPLPGHPASWLPWAPNQLRTLVIRLTPAQVPDPALSRAAVLAAAFALGTIAWTLWRHRETAHPALALDRFGDLSARVQSDAGSVHVWLPLGPRHDDLRDHGLLADVPEVPWLGGRVVRFSGG